MLRVAKETIPEEAQSYTYYKDLKSAVSDMFKELKETIPTN